MEETDNTQDPGKEEVQTACYNECLVCASLSKAKWKIVPDHSKAHLRSKLIGSPPPKNVSVLVPAPLYSIWPLEENLAMSSSVPVYFSLFSQAQLSQCEDEVELCYGS